jgi:hypothetical protein
MDAVPLIDAQTAAILGSVQKYTVQQHVKIFDNCVEQPNTCEPEPQAQNPKPQNPKRGHHRTEPTMAAFIAF